MSSRISNIFRQSQTELHVVYFHENKLPNYQIDEKRDETVPKSYLRKLLSAPPFLPSVHHPCTV